MEHGKLEARSRRWTANRSNLLTHSVEAKKMPAGPRDRWDFGRLGVSGQTRRKGLSRFLAALKQAKLAEMHTFTLRKTPTNRKSDLYCEILCMLLEPNMGKQLATAFYRAVIPAICFQACMPLCCRPCGTLLRDAKKDNP